MRSPAAGLTVAIVAAVLGLFALAAPAAASPASPEARVAGTIAPLSPVDGALVTEDPQLTWTEVLGTGYEVRWNADGETDADGALSAADGGRAFPTATSLHLSDLSSPTYHWQVRALPEGSWSEVATFHVDIQLETLDLPPVDAPTVDETATPEETPESSAAPLGGPFHGLLWVAAASSFAGILLAVVGREWFRLRRQGS